MKTKLIVVIILVIMLSTSTAVALSTSDNFSAWRKSSNSDKSRLCKVIAKRLSEPGLDSSSLCDCITGMVGNGELDFMNADVGEAAAQCAATLISR